MKKIIILIFLFITLLFLIFIYNNSLNKNNLDNNFYSNSKEWMQIEISTPNY